MAEKKIPKTKAQSDELSDSDTPDEEVDPQLYTSEVGWDTARTTFEPIFQ